MAWKYIISSGKLFLDGVLVGTCYSGHMQSMNSTNYQTADDTGPIPVGKYTIGMPYTDPQRGEMVMGLTPDPANVIQKGDFKIHGDTQSNLERGAREASARSIVASELIRVDIAEYVRHDDNVLYVIADEHHTTEEMDQPIPGTEVLSELGAQDTDSDFDLGPDMDPDMDPEPQQIQSTDTNPEKTEVHGSDATGKTDQGEGVKALPGKNDLPGDASKVDPNNPEVDLTEVTAEGEKDPTKTA
jgi:hypothetical protein